MPQEVLLLNASVSQNISFDDKSNSESMDKVIKAASLAELHHFVTENFDEGYDTIVGERVSSCQEVNGREFRLPGHFTKIVKFLFWMR